MQAIRSSRSRPPRSLWRTRRTAESQPSDNHDTRTSRNYGSNLMLLLLLLVFFFYSKKRLFERIGYSKEVIRLRISSKKALTLASNFLLEYV
jgi:hypothetical protein